MKSGRTRGYRKGIGIVLANPRGQVLLARRNDMHGQWQFPQGGIDPGERPHQAMFRELKEELNVSEAQATIVAKTRTFLRYSFPKIMPDPNNLARDYMGQELMFFLLQFHGSDSLIDVSGVRHAEFDCWSWVDYWKPVESIVAFKRDMYRRALTELKPYLFGEEY